MASLPDCVEGAGVGPLSPKSTFPPPKPLTTTLSSLSMSTPYRAWKDACRSLICLTQITAPLLFRVKTTPSVSPALLVSEIEIQKKDSSQDRPPFLSRPSEIGAGQ